jgi:hypothetical protein
MEDKEFDELTPEEKAIDNAPDLDEGAYSDSSDLSNDDDIEEPDNTEEDNNLTEEESTEIDDVIEEDDSNEDEENNTPDEPEKDNENKESILLNFGSGEIEVNDINELQTIASKALKDKTKYDRYKDDISLVQGIKEQGLSEQDLYLLVEAKKGNRQALAKLLKETNVDPYDIDIDDEEVDNYQPNEYKSDPRIVETKAIIDNLKTNQEVFTKFNNLLTNDFDEQSRTKAFEDPQLLEFIGESINSGLYEKLAPNYMKKKLLGQDSISAYISAYDEFMKSVQNQEKTKIETQAKQNNVKATKRKKASVGTKKQANNSPKKKVDIANMSDEEFEEYYRKTVGFY